MPGALRSEQSPPGSGRPPPAKRPRAAPVAAPGPRQGSLRSSKLGSGSTDLDAPSPRGTQRRTVGPCWARVRCPTRRPRPRPRQRADVGRDCSEPKLATRTSTESSLPVAAGTLGAVKGTAHGCDTASLTSKPILVNAAHTPSDSASGAFASLAWIGSDAASRKAARQRAAGCSMCRLQRDRAPVALGCNTGRVVATQCAADASHLCCAEADVPEGSRAGTEVGGGWIRLRCRCGLGMDSFAVQRWARDRLGPGADVGEGWNQSRCRCGRV